PGDAVSALRRLFIDERLLHRTRIVDRAEAFDGRNLAPGERSDRGDARERGLAVDHDRACAALTQSATEFRTVQREMIAKHIQKRRRRIGIDRASLSVNVELDHRLSPHACGFAAALPPEGE